MNDADSQNRSTIKIIVIAALIWGVVLALGTSLFTYDVDQKKMVIDLNPVRGLFVLGCVFGFIGSWLLLLRGRRSGS